jgi:hypothetical protein
MTKEVTARMDVDVTRCVDVGNRQQTTEAGWRRRCAAPTAESAILVSSTLMINLPFDTLLMHARRGIALHVYYQSRLARWDE